MFCRKDREVLTTSETYPWSFVTQIFHNGQPSQGVDRIIFEVMTSTLPKGIIGSVASILAANVCPFVLFAWPLCCQFFFDIRILLAKTKGPKGGEP
jgi:hypothetical protein